VNTYHQRTSNHAFAKYDLLRVLESQRIKLTETIGGESEDYLLNVNREDYLKHTVERFSISSLEIHADRLSAETEEMLIPADLFPAGFSVRSGRSYPKLVFTYHLPFSGDPQLLDMRANAIGFWTPSIAVQGQMIIWDYVDFRQNAEETQRRADEIVRSLLESARNVNSQLEQHNGALRAQADQIFDARKKQLLERRDYLQALKIPIRATHATTGTYAAPAPRKIEPVTPKPTVTDRGYKPEPTLDDSIYHQILEVIHNVGTGFEKLPSTYANKDEETLRDHFLIALAPNFAGSTTGETFNKAGKTDILLRHEHSNLFVAEFKIWKGPKVCLETLTQLISYLTWRDSKAAVVFFVPNRNFSEVLETIKVTIPQHPNYLGPANPSSETWFNYRLHVDGDRNRKIKVAVLLFHFPPVD
jgi:hypothetical protein